MVKAILCGQANVGVEFSAESRWECPCLLPVTDEKQPMETVCEGAGLVVSEQISKEPRKQRPSLTLTVVHRLLQEALLSCPVHSSLSQLDAQSRAEVRTQGPGSAKVICFSLELEPLAGKGLIVLLNLVTGT